MENQTALGRTAVEGLHGRLVSLVTIAWELQCRPCREERLTAADIACERDILVEHVIAGDALGDNFVAGFPGWQVEADAKLSSYGREQRLPEHLQATTRK